MLTFIDPRFINVVNRNQQGNASMHAAIFRFFFYFSA
ncbi:pheST operon leader peptide PheM [Serratia rubidaea]|nr:pheST operon leader peptide PheM [Serratia rubidaea]UJD80050.1 pheST operon leader peptide PheM [Serratia rubidaea]UJD84606.1 pheST operon leader peptide PheM [Serratia rubidaea]HAY0635885.1 pheST operon leader peptide PheM [Serratia rubidaea]